MNIGLKSSISIRKICCLLVALAVFVLLSFPLLISAAQKVPEYHVKAVFLYNLAYFVNWPRSPDNKVVPFTIGIYGPDPFGQIIDQTIAQEEKNSKPFRIIRLTSLDNNFEQCDILYMSSDAMNDWNVIHEKLSGLPILSVSDNLAFTQSGGMVSLLKNDHNKIQVQINRRGVQEAGLSISAKLLRLAKIVE